MKIKEVHYKNFRNFKEEGRVTCSTDGKVTIIYGVNGAGKTTFHQLFQWIIYGTVQFNKTTSNSKLYNLELESKTKNGDKFSVFGEIEFEHLNSSYLMRREWIYDKTIFDGVRCLSKTFTVNKRNENMDWERLVNPDEVIEQLLPSGLKDYFFFDGESMITDLKTRGRDSAGSLKDALYLMLDLSVYEKAAAYIGTTDLKTTALGTLFLNKTAVGASAELITKGQKYESAQTSRDNQEERLKKCNEEIKKLKEHVNNISEKIGSAKSQKDYENQRNEAKKNRDLFLELMKNQYAQFGEELVSVVPRLMISKITEKASKKIQKQAQQSNLVNGVNKELIDALLQEDVCICGNPLTEIEKNKLKELYKYLPPLGYDSLYRNFTDMAARWGKEYNREKLEKYIIDAEALMEKARLEDEKIVEIDKRMKEDKQFKTLVTERLCAEEKIKSLEEQKDKCNGELVKIKMLIRKLKKEIDSLSSSTKTNSLIDRKIEILEKIKQYFENILQEKSVLYSHKLEKTIQELLDQMLVAQRHVTVGQDFSLRVADSFEDESKSEGQFATVSFAYIGGIFKLLREEEILSNKEYPLVLDAPFSKLGDEPRQRVIDTIPDYAPQIILLSKDNLQDCFDKDKIGRVYTILSNEEQNVAKIEEGFLWK